LNSDGVGDQTPFETIQLSNLPCENGAPMTEDPRCCGTGTCIINEEGVCWCGQTWDGEKMCMPTALKNESPQETKNTVDLD
jgi:hypothetical protein